MQCVPSIRPRQTSSPPPPPHPGHIPPPPPVSGTMSARGFIPPPSPILRYTHARGRKMCQSQIYLPPFPPSRVYKHARHAPRFPLPSPPSFVGRFPEGGIFSAMVYNGRGSKRARQAMMIAQGVFSLGKGEKRSRHRGRGSRIIFSAHCKLDQIVPFVLKM